LWRRDVTREYVKQRYPSLNSEYEIERKIEELKDKKPEASYCWRVTADYSIKLYDFIIQVLNKYGMLFESQPKGYSNVENEISPLTIYFVTYVHNIYILIFD
jgi:hypothetical protein